jgi:hypothetical protein
MSSAAQDPYDIFRARLGLVWRMCCAFGRRRCVVLSAALLISISQIACASNQQTLPNLESEMNAISRSERGFEPWSVGMIHPSLPAVALGSGMRNRSDVPQTHYASSYDDNLFLASMYLAFRFYKETWSRADGNTCRFAPSCSRFGWQAVRRHGVWGVVLTMARLTRSHGESPLHPVDSDGLYILDPLSNYDFWYHDASGPFDAEVAEAQRWHRHIEW